MSTNTALSYTVYKGDHTGAFGRTFLTINLINPLGYVVSKAIFVCGSIKKTFDNPIFPLGINLDCEETKQLTRINKCYLIVFDEEGLPTTCARTFTFPAENGVLKENGRHCC